MECPRQNGFQQADRTPSSSCSIEKDGLKNSVTSSVEEKDITTVKQMTIQNIRQKMQKVQCNIIEEVDEKLTEIVNKLLQEVEQSDVCEKHRYVLLDDTNNCKNRVKSSKDGVIPEKQYRARNSLLTDLFENKHIQKIYNIYMAIFIFLFLNTVAHDLVIVGRLDLGFNLIQWSFHGFGRVFYVWLQMFTSTLLLFSCFYFWANQRTKWVRNTFVKKLWDYGWLCAFVTYEILFFCNPVIKLMESSAGPASSMALLLEQIRLMMKTYSFVRSNTPRALVYKPHQSGDEKQTSPCPDFSKYIYFLFAPTLLYRDTYPRTKEIRWRYVVWCFMEVIALVFYMAFIMDRYLIPIYQKFGRPEEQKSLSEFLVIGMFGSVLPCTLYMMCVFYLILHSWLNAFAEMLRFADRLFYKDWWNATSHGAYYRLWNVVVHDWLFTYIYKDISETLKLKRRWIPALTVFWISALVHEYVLMFMFRFFCPMFFISYAGFGVCFVYLTKDNMPCGNMLIWILVCGGYGIVTCVYGYEWYARVNCPQVLDPFWDFITPRLLSCKLAG